ncbi:ABC transporter ATP-binding protein [Amaricoccus solimangrovi]|uniref:ABC transporter ATP-binding protein n=1 Tax=Amaricoccus solimangrovi TaxID=2589815 RepID=A0A501WI52_9RHOB|nr:ABC transporter ATP-binding protein [Amaricoccus solimangrovi]
MSSRPILDTQQPLLKVEKIDVWYGPHHVLRSVDYELYEGEIVCLLGGNASGKSTTMKSILGITKLRGGSISFRGERIDGWETGARVKAGIAPVPEARRVFPEMTVMENLELGAYTRGGDLSASYDKVFTLFPRLKERVGQLAGTMSGGEQQMLAIGRALMSDPKLICMDEPSMGLSPLLVQRVFEIIKQLNQMGVTIFVVEQNANAALSIAHRGYVIQTGKIVMADTAANLLNDPEMKNAYLGKL